MEKKETPYIAMLKKPDEWIDSGGDVHKIGSMENRHLLCAIRMLERAALRPVIVPDLLPEVYAKLEAERTKRGIEKLSVSNPYNSYDYVKNPKPGTSRFNDLESEEGE